jgi:hypothetical protein
LHCFGGPRRLCSHAGACCAAAFAEGSGGPSPPPAGSPSAGVHAERAGRSAVLRQSPAFLAPNTLPPPLPCRLRRPAGPCALSPAGCQPSSQPLSRRSLAASWRLPMLRIRVRARASSLLPGPVCLPTRSRLRPGHAVAARLATGDKTAARSSGQTGSRSCAYRATGSCRPRRGNKRALAWKGRNRRSGESSDRMRFTVQQVAGAAIADHGKRQTSRRPACPSC